VGAGYGLSRVPTGFIPIEDQGYLLVAVQLPDGAALDRTQQRAHRVSEITRQDRRASIRSSPLPASPRSTIPPASPMPAWPI
jgi:multidrug efflux pump subunit AcrB